MIRCGECDRLYPHESDVASCIREFGECVKCKINNNDFFEDDLIWIKFISDESIPEIISVN